MKKEKREHVWRETEVACQLSRMLSNPFSPQLFSCASPVVTVEVEEEEGRTKRRLEKGSRNKPWRIITGTKMKKAKGNPILRTEIIKKGNGF